MWSGGISNPLSVIEQLTYLLSIKRIDELHTLKEHRANRTGNPTDLRWSRFKETASETIFETVRDEVFPFIKTLGYNGASEGGSTYTQHMENPLLMMPTPRVKSVFCLCEAFYFLNSRQDTVADILIP